MQRISLVNPKQSEVKFEIINFPDGEPHLKFMNELDRKDEYQVDCRITNPTDLFIVCQVADILDRLSVKWKLRIYYLMSMRMDRVISFNEPFSLKVVANMLNSFNPSEVEILEPHSQRTIDEIYESKSASVVKNIDFSKFIVVFPDKGAKERYSDFKCSNYIVTCNKVRDPNTGKLISFEITNPEVIEKAPAEMQFVVINDLCDRGGTLVGVANLLKNYNRKHNIFVTHLVNEKGIKNLCENYDFVTVTNSYKDWKSDYKNFHVIRIV